MINTDKLQLIRVFKILGLSTSDQGTGWYSFPCLFKSRHNTYNPKKHSASVKYISTDGAGYFCHSCKAAYKDIMLALFQAQREPSSIPVEKINEAIAYLESGKHPHPVACCTNNSQSVIPQPIQPTPFKKGWLDQYPIVNKSPEAMTYLHSRGIENDCINTLKLRFDPKAKRVIFPFFLGSKLVGALGRLIKHNPLIIGSNMSPKYLSYNDQGKDNLGLVWYRQSELYLRKPLVLVEGVFDVVAVLPYCQNVTAICGSFPSQTKLEYLRRFKSIYYMGDNDRAGIWGGDKLLGLFPRMRVINIPDTYKDPSEVPKPELVEILKVNGVI